MKYCNVNLQFLSQNYKDGKYQNTYTIKTILDNGIIREVPYEDFDIIEIYVSYKGLNVNVLKFENIFKNAANQVNNIYIEKDENGEVLFWFVGMESKIGEKDVFKTILIPKEKFYKANNTEKEEIKEYNQLFFNRN